MTVAAVALGRRAPELAVCKPKPTHPGSHPAPPLQQPIQGMLVGQGGLSIHGHSGRVKGLAEKERVGGWPILPMTPRNPVHSSGLAQVTTTDVLELRDDPDVHWVVEREQPERGSDQF